MGLFDWLLGEKPKSKYEQDLAEAMQKGHERRAEAVRVERLQAEAKFNAMIDAQRNGGGTVAGGVRLTSEGQVDLDGFDLTVQDAEALERFKARHNGGFEPTTRISTVTVNPVTQQEQVTAQAKLPTGQFDPLGKTELNLNRYGTVMAQVEDIPSSALLNFKEKAGLNATPEAQEPATEEDRAFHDALAKIGAKPREFNPQ